MALFHHENRRRHILGIAIAMAAHVERNTPQVFPKATTDLLEEAADELLSDDELTFETITVVKRALAAVIARNPNRRWSEDLIEALQAINDED